MKKKSHFCIIFTLSLIFILSFILNAHAMNDADTTSLQQVLGVQPDGDYAKVDLSTTPEGSVIKATVDDPSKIGGCQKDDRVELINLGDGEWKITRLATGSGFKFTVHQENGVMKITKTKIFGQRVAKPTYGKGLEGRAGLGARVSYVNYTDDDYTVYGIKVDVEPDDAVMFGINFTYFVSNYFSFELSADYVETDFDLSIPGLSVEAGEVTQIPVLLSGRIHFSKNPKVNPYLTIGVGYFFNDIDENRNIAEAIYGPGAEIDVDNSFGFHLGGGIEFFISENVAVNLDFKYIWTEVEGEVNKPGFTDEDFEINPYVIGLGIKYYF